MGNTTQLSANAEDTTAPHRKPILRRGQKLATAFLVILPWLLLVWTGLWGLDFGVHPDQGRLVNTVHQFVETDLLVPRWYFYPSVNFVLGVATLAPDIIEAKSLENTREYLQAVLDSHEYILRFRTTYLVISSLSVLWIFALVCTWRRRWAEALLAASVLGLSWEVAYHLRFTAPDSVMMQFAALTMLCVTLAKLRPNKRAWLRLAAVAVGLACGTKYNGGALLLPVFIVAYQTRDEKTGKRGWLSNFSEILLIFAITYLITTPGTVLDFQRFIYALRYDMRVYQTGFKASGGGGEIVAWAPYTVSRGPEHLGRALVYLSFVLLSHFKPIAALFFIMAIVGVYALFKESRQMAVLFLSYPVLNLLYMSTQRAFVVRNYLVFAPFLAILAARGVGFLWEQLAGKRVLRAGLVVGVTTLLAVNGAWLVYAAETIRDRGTDRFIHELADYVVARPGTRFYVTQQVWDDLASLDEYELTNVTRDPSGADMAVFYALEAEIREAAVEAAYVTDWPGVAENWPDLCLFTTWFGPYEINFNYYPVQDMGNDRILLMPIERAHELNLRIFSQTTTE